MNEDVLSSAILTYEPESLVGFVNFHRPNAFDDLTGDLRTTGSLWRR